MSISTFNSKIVAELIEAGIIPRHCSKWEMVADVKDAVRIRSEVFVTEEQYRQIADALLRNKTEARAAVQLTVRSLERGPSDPGIGPL